MQADVYFPRLVNHLYLGLFLGGWGDGGLFVVWVCLFFVGFFNPFTPGCARAAAADAE